MGAINIALTLLIVCCLGCANNGGKNDILGNSSVKKVEGNKDTAIKHLSSKRVFDSLYAAIECNEADAEEKAGRLEGRIDSLLTTMLSALEKSNYHSGRVVPFLELLKKERVGYKSAISSSAELVFWSYGTTSMQGERKVAGNCYYLKELERRYAFYLAIWEQINSTLLSIGM